MDITRLPSLINSKTRKLPLMVARRTGDLNLLQRMSSIYLYNEPCPQPQASPGDGDRSLGSPVSPHQLCKPWCFALEPLETPVLLVRIDYGGFYIQPSWSVRSANSPRKPNSLCWWFGDNLPGRSVSVFSFCQELPTAVRKPRSWTTIRASAGSRKKP